MGEAAERFFPLLTMCLEAEAKQGRAQCRVTAQLGSSGTESTSCSSVPLSGGGFALQPPSRRALPHVQHRSLAADVSVLGWEQALKRSLLQCFYKT